MGEWGEGQCAGAGGQILSYNISMVMITLDYLCFASGLGFCCHECMHACTTICICLRSFVKRRSIQWHLCCENANKHRSKSFATSISGCLLYLAFLKLCTGYIVSLRQEI